MRKYQVRFRGGITEKGLLLPRRYPTRHQRRAQAGSGPAADQPAAAGRSPQQGQRLRAERLPHLARGPGRQAHAAYFLGHIHSQGRGRNIQRIR